MPGPRAFLRRRVGPLTVLAWLLLAMLLAIALRIPVMLNYSLLIDDGATLLAISLSPEKLIENRFRLGHIPLFFLLFKAWTELAGTSLVPLRLPSFIFSVLTIPLSAALCARLGSARAAVLAAFIAAIHGSLLRHAAELRMYSWMMVIGPTIMLLLLSHVEAPRWWKALSAGALTFLFLTFHMSAIFFILPVYTAIAVMARHVNLPPRQWAAYWAALLLPLLAYIPLLLHLKNSVDMKEYTKFTVMNPHERLLRAFYELIVGIEMGGALWRVIAVGIIFPALALVVYLLANPRGERTAVFSRRQTALLYLIVGFSSPLLAWFASQFGPNIIGYTRYYITGTVPLVAFIAACLMAVRWHGGILLRIATILFLILSVMTAEMTYYRMRRVLFHKPTGLNKLVSDFKRTAPDGTTLIIPDQGATRRIVEVYLGHDATRLRILPISQDWSPQRIQDSLRKNLTANQDIYFFFYRDVDQPIIDLAKSVLTTPMNDDKLASGESTLIHLHPRKPIAP